MKACFLILLYSASALAQTVTATGTFDVMTKLDVPEAGKESTAIGHLSLNKKFAGDLQGESKVEMLTAMTPVKDSGTYIALEQVTGKLQGHEGTFVLQHSGTMRAGKQELDVKVVPDSATGQLTGLEGKMNIRIENGQHFYDFTYSLPKPAKL